VVVVDPRIKTNQKPPPVVVKEVFGNRKKVWDYLHAYRSSSGPATEPALRIAPGRGELEIHFAALSLAGPEKNRFRYRLEGVDPGWVDAGANRAARYTNLRPGRYRFQVIGSNNDGVWNNTGAALAVVFLPHFWQAWWFNYLLILTFGLVLIVAYRLRIQRLKAIEHLRVQIAADLHDDVGSRLTKLAMITESTSASPGAAENLKKPLQLIGETTGEVIQAMDEIVWTINPKNDTLEQLANYFFQYAQEYFQDTGVRCRLDFPASLPDMPIRTEERHNLFMAYKEALNNVLKHARATEVRVRLAVEERKLTVAITDDGAGFVPDSSSRTRNGLANMRRRLEVIGGRFMLESGPGEGTRVVLEAKL
jgi:signal transduction histidine kinase